MFRILGMLLALSIFSVNSYAGFEGPGAATKIATVKAVNEMKDDAKVTLEGHIIKQLRKEHYMFKDDTGEIEIEIDDDEFRGQTVTPENKVRIYGEVEKGWFGPAKVEVDSLEILK